MSELAAAIYICKDTDLQSHRRAKAATRLAHYRLRQWARMHDVTLHGDVTVDIGHPNGFHTDAAIRCTQRIR